MLVLVQDKAVAALAHVAPHGVDAVVLAAAVVLGALVLICGGVRDAWVSAVRTGTRQYREEGRGRERRRGEREE